MIVLFCQGIKAQTETPVITPGKDRPADSIPSYMRPVPAVLPDSSAAEINAAVDPRLECIRSTLEMKSIFSPRVSPRRYVSGPVTAPGLVAFPVFDGALTFAGSSNSLPGMMGIETGSVSFTRQFGNLTVSAYADASHYGYFRGMQTSWGFGGSLTYRVNERLAFTAFGSYSSPLRPVNPAMASYMSVPSFGGYASIELNEHWGVNVGAQANRSLVTNRWEAQPIVEPFYKINGKAAIGVDVGGILYQLIRSHSEGHGRSNPTIGPPVGGPPPVRPYPGR